MAPDDAGAQVSPHPSQVVRIFCYRSPRPHSLDIHSSLLAYDVHTAADWCAREPVTVRRLFRCVAENLQIDDGPSALQIEQRQLEVSDAPAQPPSPLLPSPRHVQTTSRCRPRQGQCMFIPFALLAVMSVWTSPGPGSVHSGLVNATLTSSEQTSLLNFYAVTSGSGWTAASSTGWNTATDGCTWAGVSCSSDGAHVT